MKKHIILFLFLAIGLIALNSGCIKVGGGRKSSEGEIEEEDLSLIQEVRHPVFDNPLVMIMIVIGIISVVMAIYIYFHLNKQSKAISAYKKSKTQEYREELKEERDKKEEK